MDSGLILELAYRKGRRIRTIDDLWSIPVEPSKTLIKPMEDPYKPRGEIGLDAIKKGWVLYQAYASKPRVMLKWEPRLVTKLERFKWNLRIKLIEWKII